MPEVQPPRDPAVERIPLVEEEAVIGKRTVETGHVRVRTVVDEREEMVRDLLLREDVKIERVPVGRTVTEMPRVRQEGDTTIIPIVDEVVVVEKRLVLREELRIAKLQSIEPIEQPVTLRSTRTVIERTADQARLATSGHVTSPTPNKE